METTTLNTEQKIMKWIFVLFLTLPVIGDIASAFIVFFPLMGRGFWSTRPLSNSLLLLIIWLAFFLMIVVFPLRAVILAWTAPWLGRRIKAK